MEVKQPYKFPHFTATDLVKFSENESEISQGHVALNPKKVPEMVLEGYHLSISVAHVFDL